MKTNGKADTFFIPAERTPIEEIKIKAQNVLKENNIKDILDALPDTVAMLDENRQIIFANKLLLSLLGLNSDENILGMRPGEALNCKHAYNNDNCPSCGTTEY